MNGSRSGSSSSSGSKILRPRRKSQTEVQQPVLDFRCSGGSGNGLSFGSCQVQGYRPHMEDRHVARPCVSEASPVYRDASFFAVFDGHGGDWVSSFCVKDKCSFLDFLVADEQLTNLLKQQSPICDYRDCLRRLFLAYDRKVRREIDYKQNRGDSCGCTCVMLLVCKRHLLLANCGDSRGVVYIDYGNYYNRVTVDHSVAHVLNRDISSVELRAERQRFEGLRYEMDRDRGLRRPNDNHGHGLMVTRAFGDYDFKGDDLHNLVTAEPAINHSTYFVKGHERVAVLASDGIWDVFGTEEVCEFVLGQLRRRSSLQAVSQDVCHCALEAGSRDNMTALVVCFDKNVQRCVDADAARLRQEAATLAEAMLQRQRSRPLAEMSDLQQAQFLHDTCERMVQLTAGNLFPADTQHAASVKCFNRLSYYFWHRRARRMLEQLQRESAQLSSAQQLPALAEIED